MGTQVLAQALQDHEELLAAPRLVVEGHQQAAAPPHTGAPRRAGDGFVDQGAQRVARSRHGFHVHLAGAGLSFKGLHRLDQTLAQAFHVRHGGEAAQRHHQIQQRVGRAHQRVEPLPL